MCSRLTRIAASTTAAWARLKPWNGRWFSSCTTRAAEARPLLVLDDRDDLQLGMGEGLLQHGARHLRGRPASASRAGR